MAASDFSKRRCLARSVRGGFTLLELLVVVFVIVLLVAILIPSLSEARRQASRLSCASHLRLLGQALNLCRTERGRYPLRTPPPTDPSTFAALSNVSNPVVTTLVRSFLGRPDALYCPTSLQDDPCADPPYIKTPTSTTTIRHWETGQISYFYLNGIVNVFKDAVGEPTFNPATEAPGISPAPRLILVGDRTVELAPKKKNIPGSNHGRKGGWFCYTTGDVLWRRWDRLTAHPTHMYIWYWPSMCNQPIASVAP